jgi:hypothetical protein
MVCRVFGRNANAPPASDRAPLELGRPRRWAGALALALCAALGGCGGGGGGSSGNSPAVNGPAWWGFARDAQHSARGGVATQTLSRMLWRTAVDAAPQYSPNGALLIHYGSPVISSHNTVLVPMKTGTTGGFRVEAHAGADGALMWSADSDYILPPHNWTPSFNVALTTGERLYWPGAGGKLFYRDNVDAATGTVQTAVFYGAEAYAASKQIYDANIVINTPLTIDLQGNVFFGFVVLGANPAGLTSGIVRIGADGKGSSIAATTAAADATMGRVAMNAGPALSPDAKTLYAVVTTDVPLNVHASGYLVALDAATLAPKGRVLLRDPGTSTPAWLNTNSSASPTVGPDGDVYYGVLEANPPAHNFRGWLLHYDATLAVAKAPAAFGADDTASIVPSPMVPSYAGASAYLLAIKYNNYGGVGSGDGKNRMAIVDPGSVQADTISGIPVMKEILTILGPTADSGFPGGVKEWCINTAAVDPLTRSVLVNSEDGMLYRWNLVTNAFSEKIRLGDEIGEAYTPTAIGPDGAVYAVNNAVLYAVGH